MKSLVLRLAAVVSVGIGASACSSVPDWVDPTSWLQDKSPPAADNGRATDLADIPGKPPTSTPDERKQVADSLAADRAQSNYSAEQLRADTEQSAAPPPPPPPPDSTTSAPAAKSNKDVPPPEPAASTRPTSYQATPRPPVTEATASSEPSQATPASAEAPSTTSSPAPAAAQADSSLGFQPSSAPPLDPSVSQFAPPAVVSSYQRTASASATPAAAPPAGTTQPTTPVSTSATAGAPAAVVLFPGDGIVLDATARTKVREAASAYQSNGANGFVRVVGHSSSRTANMPAQQHIEVVFQRSQDRANAVASELIRDGVPAAKILVEAVGDSQPIYAESMPKGEEGNRRAEIFFQS